MSEAKVVKSFFDFVNDLSNDKRYLLDSTTKSKYESFMINRALSQNADTIMYANEMNKYPNIDKLLQHDFLYYIVSAKKRYGKWAKHNTTNDDVLDLITNHYKVNRVHARQYLELMDDDDIQNLKNTYEIGGRSR